MNKDIVKFLKHLFVFLLFLGVIFYCINYIYFYQFVYNNGKKFKDSEILSGVQSIDYLFVGDSRPATAINPEFIPGSYNYCFEGENYSQVHYRIRKILDNRKINVLVLPLDIHSFSDYRSNPYREMVYWYDFLSIEELSRQTGKPESLVFINKYFPFIGNGRDFVNFSLTGGNVDMGFVDGYDILGEESRSENSNKKILARGRVLEHFKNYPEIINEELFGSFIKIIELARDKNVKIVLVQYPFSEDYLNEVGKLGININGFYDDIDEKIIKYDHISVLDYRTGFGDEYFFNADHMNVKGAEFFSKQLADDLRKLNLIN